MAARRFISSEACNAASAAACATLDVENGVMTLRTVAATSGAATMKPTRRPARPHAFDSVRSTTTLGRSA